MQSPAFDPSTLPLRDIHLPESVGWWPPAPGWWLLPVLILLALAAAWYARLLYRRRRYSAVNMAKRELVEIRSRYDMDRDAVYCVRAVSALLRRVSISIFPRAQSAGLTGGKWLEFLLSGDSSATLACPRPATYRGSHSEQGLSAIQAQGSKGQGHSFSLPWRKRDRVRGKVHVPDSIGKLLLEAPYRRQVADDEVRSLLGFCSDWIDGLSRSKP